MKFTYIYLLLLLPILSFAQHTPEEISKEYVAYAYDLLEKEDYDHALIKTDEIISLLPRSTAELQYIRALAHHHLDLDIEAQKEVEDMYNYPMTDELKMHADELSLLLKHEIVKEEDTEKDSSGKVYKMAEVGASYPGGMGEFYNWFHGALHSHGVDREGHGRIYVQFVVNIYGNLDDVKIIKGVSEGIDQQVLKILGDCPKWMVAVQNGKPVEQKIVLPLNLEEHPY
ncbi:energy transducer TonB [Flammeovirga sp. SubArs3]|uniref:energy transducer TonB n=1 Tax=Flammeovirga sp. SubArs3 TaxID=2995316 RepID=UPI00248C85A6|nr:energy transducer TonB [Flammeovirga sp. SubArs3]